MNYQNYQKYNLLEKITFDLAIDDFDQRYLNSPFQHLCYCPTRHKGQIYEKIVKHILEKNHCVHPPKDTIYDLIVDGNKIEIKGAVLGKNSSNHFTFLNIKPKNNFDDILFLFLFPFNLFILKLTKEQLMESINKFKPQKNDSFIITTTVDKLIQMGATFYE